MKRLIRASRNDRDYFGQDAAEKYGDLIADNLAGKTVSKRIFDADKPGGIKYEAEKLGIDLYDLLEALEGMCYAGRAREIDDSTYLVEPDMDRIDPNLDVAVKAIHSAYLNAEFDGSFNDWLKTPEGRNQLAVRGLTKSEALLYNTIVNSNITATESVQRDTLKQRLLDVGYPLEDMDHHYSDLYVYVTPLTTKVIQEWCDDNGYRMAHHCPKFRDAITGRPMYDCAFSWYE